MDKYVRTVYHSDGTEDLDKKNISSLGGLKEDILNRLSVAPARIEITYKDGSYWLFKMQTLTPLEEVDMTTQKLIVTNNSSGKHQTSFYDLNDPLWSGDSIGSSIKNWLERNLNSYSNSGQVTLEAPGNTVFVYTIGLDTRFSERERKAIDAIVDLGVAAKRAEEIVKRLQ